MNKIFFITGVNGVGKTTVVALLKKALSECDFSVYDFDERGVPDNADKNWRQKETSYWVGKAKENLKSKLSTVVCGFMKFPEIFDAAENLEVSPKMCLLDVDEGNIEKRILSRYQTPESLLELERTTGKTTEKFVADNIWVSERFRAQAKEKEIFIIDTSNREPHEVTDTLLHWMQN